MLRQIEFAVENVHITKNRLLPLTTSFLKNFNLSTTSS